MRFTQLVFQNKISNLFDLVRFSHTSLRLDIDYLGNTIPIKNIMVSFNPLVKAKSSNQRAQFVKADVFIASP